MAATVPGAAVVPDFFIPGSVRIWIINRTLFYVMLNIILKNDQ